MLHERPRHWIGSRRLAVGVVLALLAILATVLVVQADAIGTYDQCSNNLGQGFPLTDPDPGCHWINGNLNVNNSRYPEGSATVQRLWLSGLTPGSTHNITFQYGTTKNGKHAYDYLTRWNWSENWITDADRCQGITGCEAASTESLLTIPHDPNLPAGWEAGTRYFVMRGGALTQVLSGPELVSGTYAGDSETAITIEFKVGDAGGPMCDATGCGVAIWFGAHVALTVQWQAHDGTTGAGSIPGSPYHVAFEKWNGDSSGRRDNQMQSATTTDANVASFTATGGYRSITVNWETVSEGDNVGFNLYRSSTSDGRIMTKLNAQLIPTLLPPGSLGGATYTYVDRAAMKPRMTFYYWLQAVDIDGGTALFAPVAAQAR